MDRRNGTNQWIYATNINMGQLGEYDNFKDLGKDSSVPVKYKKIRVHLVYDANHYGLHKVRLVADVNLTDIQVESVFLGLFPSVVYKFLRFLLSSIR